MTEELLATIWEEAEEYLNCDDRASLRRMMELKKKLRSAGATKAVCIAVETILTAFRAREARKGADSTKLKEGIALVLDKLPFKSDLNLKLSANAGAQMSDEKYTIQGGQQGAVGHQARAHDFTQQQVVAGSSATLDLPVLAVQLEMLKKEMQKEAVDTEHFTELAAIAQTEKAAKEGDESKVWDCLKPVGKWTWDMSQKIAVPVVTEVIKKLIFPA